MTFILQWWPVILTVAGVMIWFIRLENRIALRNQAFKMHKAACEERHRIEKEHDTESIRIVRESIENIFAILRDVQGTVNEIKGWKNGVMK